jgi:ankyrin repeat protein
VLLLLLFKGGNINAKDKKNMMPLHCACWKGQTKAVEFLLNNGAQIAEVDSSLKTALHWSVQFGHFETLLTLLKVSWIFCAISDLIKY